MIGIGTCGYVCYTPEEELRQLSDKVQSLEDRYEIVYCMFNNDAMFENADRLKEILDE